MEWFLYKIKIKTTLGKNNTPYQNHMFHVKDVMVYRYR